MTRSEEIYLYHAYMYGDCDCIHCDNYKTLQKAKAIKLDLERKHK